MSEMMDSADEWLFELLNKDLFGEPVGVWLAILVYMLPVVVGIIIVENENK